MPDTLRRFYDLVMRLWQRSDDARLGLISAGVAFFGFLAIFPAVATVISIWGFASDPEVIRQQLTALKEFLPEQAYQVLDEQVQGLIASSSRVITWTTVLPTLFALWSARAGVDSLIQGLDAAYGTSHRNGFWHTVQAIILTMALVSVSLASVLVAIIVPLLLAVLPIGADFAWFLERLNEVVGLVVLVIGLWIAYRFGPNHTGTQRPLVLPGLVFAAVLWFAASRGFMLYLANFTNFNHIYGSIGAVVALLMWFWFSALAVLLGAALNAVLRPDDQ